MLIVAYEYFTAKHEKVIEKLTQLLSIIDILTMP